MNVSDKSKARHYTRDGITSYLMVSNEASGAKKLTATLVEMEPGGFQGIHTHEAEQCYYILEGHGRMTIGDEIREVSAGMCVFIPSNDPHGLVNSTDSPLRYFSASTPPYGAELERSMWPVTGD